MRGPEGRLKDERDMKTVGYIDDRATKINEKKKINTIN